MILNLKTLPVLICILCISMYGCRKKETPSIDPAIEEAKQKEKSAFYAKKLDEMVGDYDCTGAYSFYGYTIIKGNPPAWGPLVDTSFQLNTIVHIKKVDANWEVTAF